ncbi:MAG TPA: MazG nucleotide pyrophosphohydrolase domain-containing protein [Candidatus Deferrimicrobium sp.]|nr:MazG nucleotide pyrophosphohydrolase domain-containing protein [Candidatus Deferrimicrobium sp.]
MRSLYFERDRTRGVFKTFLWIIEEVGELAETLRDYNVQNKDTNKLKDIEMEIADVIAWVTSLANILQIDLEKALSQKYPLICPKCRKNPCGCEFK